MAGAHVHFFTHYTTPKLTRGFTHAHRYDSMDYSFPRVEFPLYASAEQASGQSRQYLEPRINATAAGSFSAAAMGANGALMFRRQGVCVCVRACVRV